MKNLKLFLTLIIVGSMITSCIDDDNDELTGDAVIGGLVEVGSPLISYVVGSGNTYTATGNVYQGSVLTSTIDVFKSFTTIIDGVSVTSNEVLQTSISVNPQQVSQTANFSLDFDYDDLIAGLMIDGSPLPANDGDLTIGDFWTFRYVSNTSNGSSNSNSSTTKIAVGTRYAGIYSVVESSYYNGESCSGLCGGNWNGDDRIIESVNATIYRHKGLAYWDDNEFYFTVDNTSGYITIMDVDLAGDALLLNGSPAMTCEGAGGTFEWITCDPSTSFANPDDVNGADELNFTTGYFRGVGKTREFFEKLVKQ